MTLLIGSPCCHRSASSFGASHSVCEHVIAQDADILIQHNMPKDINSELSVISVHKKHSCGSVFCCWCSVSCSAVSGKAGMCCWPLLIRWGAAGLDGLLQLDSDCLSCLTGQNIWHAASGEQAHQHRRQLHKQTQNLYKEMFIYPLYVAKSYLYHYIFWIYWRKKMCRLWHIFKWSFNGQTAKDIYNNDVQFWDYNETH